MFVTINDYQRIIGMIEIAAMRTKIPDAVDRLLTSLKRRAHAPARKYIGRYYYNEFTCTPNGIIKWERN